MSRFAGIHTANINKIAGYVQQVDWHASCYGSEEVYVSLVVICCPKVVIPWHPHATAWCINELIQ